MHCRKISVIGLGYVGLPVAIAFGKKDDVIGFDISVKRIQELQKNIDETREVSIEAIQSSKVEFTSDPIKLKKADFHIIAVPTPVDNAKSPDLGAVLAASKTVGSILKKGDIVVYESTVYPGATEEDCVPVLEKSSGLVCGKDFFVGYSPERINPGDKIHTFEEIIKVVSGQNEATAKIVADVYSSVVKAGVHIASSIKVAEAAKIIENTQRDINIALMNELSLIFHRIGIDTLEVLAAARTKWNFLPFSPGLVGGHCIGVDPYYLTHLASRLGYTPQVILAGRRINDEMGSYIASQIIKKLSHTGRPIQGSTLTILGLTFKENVSDIRNTKVADIIRELKEYGVDVQIHDPHCDPEAAMEEYGVEVVARDRLRPCDVVVLAVAHREFAHEGWKFTQSLLKKTGGLVFDLKGTLDKSKTPENVSLWRL